MLRIFRRYVVSLRDDPQLLAVLDTNQGGHDDWSEKPTQVFRPATDFHLRTLSTSLLKFIVFLGMRPYFAISQKGDADGNMFLTIIELSFEDFQSLRSQDK